MTGRSGFPHLEGQRCPECGSDQVVEVRPETASLNGQDGCLTCEARFPAGAAAAEDELIDEEDLSALARAAGEAAASISHVAAAFTLQEHLEELERTNPEVKRAADNYDRTVREILDGP